MKLFFSFLDRNNLLIGLCALGLTICNVPVMAADSNRELQDEISKRGISPKDVDMALWDKFPMSNFPYYEPVNGCSTPWYTSILTPVIIRNINFRSACNNHDRCYMTLGASKFSCDSKMFDDISNICSSRNTSCPISSEVYYYGVDKYGRNSYDISQKNQAEYTKQASDWLETQVPVTGIWNSSEGSITFQQSVSNVSATYTQDNGAIEGIISNNILAGYWIENSSASRCSFPRNGRNYWGRVRFVFNGSSFRGLWSYCDNEPKRAWTGSRRRY